MQKWAGRRPSGERVTTTPPLRLGHDTMRLDMSTPFSDPPDQLGCVVPDLQVAISEWAAKGVGPFLTMRKVTLGGYRYEGRSSKPKLDVAFSQQGDLQIELIQPVNDEPSAYRDFLAAGAIALTTTAGSVTTIRPRSLRPNVPAAPSSSEETGARRTSSTTTLSVTTR